MRTFLLSAISALVLVACSQPAETAKDPATDPTCVAYFDGCNSCTKMQGGTVTACTKKYCAPEAMEEPYCVKYAE